jgi:hypothetical protein
MARDRGELAALRDALEGRAGLAGTKVRDQVAQWLMPEGANLLKISTSEPRSNGHDHDPPIATTETSPVTGGFRRADRRPRMQARRAAARRN